MNDDFFDESRDFVDAPSAMPPLPRTFQQLAATPAPNYGSIIYGGVQPKAPAAAPSPHNPMIGQTIYETNSGVDLMEGLYQTELAPTVRGRRLPRSRRKIQRLNVLNNLLGQEIFYFPGLGLKSSLNLFYFQFIF